MSAWHFNKSLAKLAIAKMIVVDELPFSFVEREDFRNLINVVCPMFKLSIRWTIRKDCLS